MLDKIKSVFSKRDTSTSDIVNTAGIGNYIYMDNQDFFNIPRTKDFLRIPEISRAIELIAGQAGQITVGLWENSEDGDIRHKNELSKIVDYAPNKLMGKQEFMTNIVIDYFIEGNVVLIPTYHKEDDRYYLSNITYKPWRYHCHAQGDGNGGYSIFVDGKEFSPNDVIHLKRLRSRNNQWEGMGLREVLKDTVDSLTVSNSKMNTFMRGAIFPKMILSVDTDAVPISKADRGIGSTNPIDITNPGNAKNTGPVDINNSFGSFGNNQPIEEIKANSAKNFGENIIKRYLDMGENEDYILIPGKIAKVEQIKPTNIKDTALIEAVKSLRETISLVFGLPQDVILGGKFDDKARNAFINDTIRPFMNLYCQELTRVLLFSDNYYFKPHTKSLMSMDFDKRADSVSQLVRDGIITNNEAREELGYSKVDDEDADKLRQLENYVELDGTRRRRRYLERGDDDNEQERD